MQCGALDDSLNPVMEAYKNMLYVEHFLCNCGVLGDSRGACHSSADAIPYPSKFTLLFRALWPYIPMRFLKLVQYIPTRDHVRFRKTLKIINNFAKGLIDEKTEAVLAGQGEKKKDIMSILGSIPRSFILFFHSLTCIFARAVKANASENPKQRLTDEEMMSQMATFLLAGTHLYLVPIRSEH